MVVRKGIALTLALAGLLLLAPSASANFHLIKIREIRAAAGGAIPFVELQMYAPGQTQLFGHTVTTYGSTGTVIDTVPMSNVTMGDSQRTILVAPGPVESVTPDVTHNLGFSTPGGAVCFDAIPVDCVAYGSFAGSLPGAVGTPVPGYPAAPNSITRSVAAGCSTLLESSDDTDVSSADFAITPATPRNNSTAPTETECGPGGGGGGGGSDNPPQTKIDKGPAKKIEKTTAKFRFSADEQGAKFECKLDKGAFKSCSSPKKYKHLDLGKHKFQVFATDSAGNEDQSPATYKFKVVEG
ncbi:MAG: hypothetical protein ACHQJ5_09775 [Vicinamibacteria bacterium]|jgi:hypothetical protein